MKGFFLPPSPANAEVTTQSDVFCGDRGASEWVIEIGICGKPQTGGGGENPPSDLETGGGGCSVAQTRVECLLSWLMPLKFYGGSPGSSEDQG